VEIAAPVLEIMDTGILLQLYTNNTVRRKQFLDVNLHNSHLMKTLMCLKDIILP
jgi:hypothetical protein